LVASCDRYADLWRLFFELFRRFWPDCPRPVYLLSNTVPGNIPGVTDLLVGPDRSWSDSLREGLLRLDQEYVFLFLDDLFLRAAVEAEAVLDLMRWAQESGANYLRFTPAPKPDRPLDARVGSISPGAIYRGSTVLSLWKRAVLLDLLVPGETAWEFEVFGSARSDKYDGFYCTWKRYLPVVNGVIKGKWDRRAVRRLGALGASVDLARRPLLTLGESARLRLQEVRGWLLRRFPARYQRRIKHAVLRGRYTYKVLGRGAER